MMVWKAVAVAVCELACVIVYICYPFYGVLVDGGDDKVRVGSLERDASTLTESWSLLHPKALKCIRNAFK